MKPLTTPERGSYKPFCVAYGVFLYTIKLKITYARVISRDREEQKGWGSRGCTAAMKNKCKKHFIKMLIGCRDDNASALHILHLVPVLFSIVILTSFNILKCFYTLAYRFDHARYYVKLIVCSM